jgi:aminomethyltransferase
VENAEEGTGITDVSLKYGQIALQGPKAQLILQKLVSEDLNNIGFFRFKEHVDAKGLDLTVSRTGYTGEDGFEILVDAACTPELWAMLLDAGEREGLLPVGLGARDTLRFEAALPLYGHELSKDISPLEAGLARFVKPDKGDFIGRVAIVAQKEKGTERILAGFEMVDRGVARNGYDVYCGQEKIGFVTSGSYSPSTGKNLGLVLVSRGFSQPGTEIDVIIREKPVKAKVVEIPFYSKKYKK